MATERSFMFVQSFIIGILATIARADGALFLGRVSPEDEAPVTTVIPNAEHVFKSDPTIAPGAPNPYLPPNPYRPPVAPYLPPHFDASRADAPGEVAGRKPHFDAANASDESNMSESDGLDNASSLAANASTPETVDQSAVSEPADSTGFDDPSTPGSVDEASEQSTVSEIADATVVDDVSGTTMTPALDSVDETRATDDEGTGCPPRVAEANVTDNLDEKAKFWMELKPRSNPDRTPKLAVLMLAEDRVENANLWASWMKEAHEAGIAFHFVIHASISEPAAFVTKFFVPFVINGSVPVQPCDSWEAQMLLMRQVLRDPSVTHMVLVSSDSLPLKPLDYMHKELASDARSRMCSDRSPALDAAVPVAAESWWVLRRADAELFVEHRKLVGQVYRRKAARCANEGAWYLPLLQRELRWGAPEDVLETCIMFSDWQGTCRGWEHAKTCDCPSLWAASHTPSDGAQPARWVSLQEPALEELRRSSFWFGRQFGQAEDQDRAALVKKRGSPRAAQVVARRDSPVNTGGQTSKADGIQGAIDKLKSLVKKVHIPGA